MLAELLVLAVPFAALPCLADEPFEALVAGQSAPLAAQGQAQGDMVKWGPRGGEAPATRSSRLSRGGEYGFESKPEPWNKFDKGGSCSAPAGADFAAIRKAIGQKDVAAALAKKRALYGADRRCGDIGILTIDVMGAVLMVGGKCPKGGEHRACQDTCVDAPAGVQALADALKALDARMAASVPACKAARGF